MKIQTLQIYYITYCLSMQPNFQLNLTSLSLLVLPAERSTLIMSSNPQGNSSTTQENEHLFTDDGLTRKLGLSTAIALSLIHI